MKKFHLYILLFVVAFIVSNCKQISSRYSNSGRELYLARKYPEALKEYNKAIKFDDNKKNREFRGYVYCSLSKYELAIEDFNIALSENTCYDPESFMRRGDCYNFLENYNAALLDYKQAILRNCNHRDYVFSLLGGVQKKLGDYVGAIRSFDEAIRLKSNYFDYYLLKGSTEYDYQDYHSALNTFSSSLTADKPDLGLVYFFMGNCNFKLRQYNSAVYTYTNSIQYNLYNKELLGNTYFNRGLVFLKYNSNSQACNDFSKALECGNEDAQEYISEYCHEKHY